MKVSRQHSDQMEFLTPPLLFNEKDLSAPPAYAGILAFHKYWGKKPYEPLAYLIERLTDEGDIVLDPFMGSGVSGFAANHLHRKFIGIDLNPVAHKLSSLVLEPPSRRLLQHSLKHLETLAKPRIQETYQTGSSHLPISHLLWDEDKLVEVWANDGRKRKTFEPQTSDYERASASEQYVPSFRTPTLFKNSRINASPGLGWQDFFTGRALQNIDCLLESIDACEAEARNVLQLCLTASLGQMSKMVFAITGRGKTSGEASEKIEVGSWVIGFWRPKVHFEINVWNCFYQRAQKLVKALPETGRSATIGSLSDLLERDTDAALLSGDALSLLEQVPNGSVRLILTDPPHSDRVPYLELSEIWNAVLNLDVKFEEEVVVSNANVRGKTHADYTSRMNRFIAISARKLRADGVLAIMFNARTSESWDFFTSIEENVSGEILRFQGCFPLEYSARSVVQDNRAGALKNDFVLLFAFEGNSRRDFRSIPGWSKHYPEGAMKEDAVNV